MQQLQLLLLAGFIGAILTFWQRCSTFSKRPRVPHKTYQHTQFAQFLSKDEAGDAFSGQRKMRFVKTGDSAIRVINDVLSAVECQALIAEAEAEGFLRPEAFDASARSCKRLHTVDPSLSDVIMGRIQPSLPGIMVIDGARWRLSRFTHHWRYVKYSRGGHFIPHFDGSKLLKGHEMTVFTFQIYLNDDFIGGQTQFYTDFHTERLPSHSIDYGHVTTYTPGNPPTHSVNPKTGSALVFDHASRCVLHSAADVEEGFKYILRGDIMYTAVEEDIRILRNPALKEQGRSWCEETAEKYGTRTYTGQVWWCECAADRHGADCCIDDLGRKSQCSTASSHGSSAEGINLLLMSGKRACGKDFVASILVEELEAAGVSVHRVALGSVNKRAYAERMGIDAQRLMNDRAFKEEHRIAMVQHHTDRNAEDPSWCLKAVFDESVLSGKKVMLLTDLRTQEDLKWLLHSAADVRGSVHLLRVDASDEARSARGWDKHPVKDSLSTETDFDSFTAWTAIFDNSDQSTGGEAFAREWVRNTVMMRLPAALALGWNGSLG